MKNLFNNISQDEKNRILEMHSAKKSVISEQSLTPVQKTINSLPKPKPIDASRIDGQTVNLYRDKGETNLFGTVKILKPVKEGNIIKVMLDSKKKINGLTRYLEFKCTAIESVLVFKGTNPQNYAQKELRPIELFNLKFFKRLQSEYCATSRGGVSVPKADFAMNNQQDNTTTDVG